MDPLPLVDCPCGVVVSIAIEKACGSSLYGDGSHCNRAQDKGAARGPFPYTRKSIAEGKKNYLVNCVECHDQDGKGWDAVIFPVRRGGSHDPDAWTHGTTEKAICRRLYLRRHAWDVPSFVVTRRWLSGVPCVQASGSVRSAGAVPENHGVQAFTVWS